MQHQDLLARLESVEKQNRQIKTFGGLALGALVMGLGFSFSQPNPVCDTVTAERFQLVDYRGNTRALWDAYGRDEAILKLNQKNGQGAITIQMDDSGAGMIAMSDTKGRVRSTMKMGQDGVPEIAMYDSKGTVVKNTRGENAKGDYLEKNSR